MKAPNPMQKVPKAHGDSLKKFLKNPPKSKPNGTVRVGGGVGRKK